MRIHYLSIYVSGEERDFYVQMTGGRRYFVLGPNIDHWCALCFLFNTACSVSWYIPSVAANSQHRLTEKVRFFFLFLLDLTL
jgi:hypothetical protein